MVGRVEMMELAERIFGSARDEEEFTCREELAEAAGGDTNRRRGGLNGNRGRVNRWGRCD